MNAKELIKKAESIEAAAQHSDDPNSYRRDMEAARMLRAKASKLMHKPKERAAVRTKAQEFDCKKLSSTCKKVAAQIEDIRGMRHEKQ